MSTVRSISADFSHALPPPHPHPGHALASMGRPRRATGAHSWLAPLWLEAFFSHVGAPAEAEGRVRRVGRLGAASCAPLPMHTTAQGRTAIAD